MRERPHYPFLKNDGGQERSTTEGPGSEDIRCNKFYSKYRTNGLTGGLLVLWCPHGSCVGFHCLPRGEGRNDVFSALYTFWETAPEVIVYDFGCELGPYCMLRAPDFFQNTRFLIDDFHAQGHSRCSRACMTKNYRWDPEIYSLATPIAESGNALLGPIRDSLRYMTQFRAVLYVNTFMCVHNRMRRLRWLREGKLKEDQFPAA